MTLEVVRQVAYRVDVVDGGATLTVRCEYTLRVSVNYVLVITPASHLICRISCGCCWSRHGRWFLVHLLFMCNYLLNTARPNHSAQPSLVCRSRPLFYTVRQ